MRKVPMRNRTAELCVTILLCCGALPLAAQTIQINKENKTIAITTNDSASVEADTAIVHIGFELFAPDSDAAYAKGSEASNAVMKAVKALGIPQDTIQSDSQGISENYNFNDNQGFTPEQKAARRFRIQQSWSVKVKAADAGTVLHEAISAGANQSGQIDWTVADEDALEAQAAGKALVRARAIAEQMAKGLNAKLGNLIYASNEAAARPVFALAGGTAYGFGGGIGGGRFEQKTTPLAIIPQKVTRSATVYAVFAIE